MFRSLTHRAGRLAAATCAAATLALTATASAAPPIETNWPAPTPNLEADPFYTPPTTIPTGEPGDPIRVRPAKAGPPRARELADAWQVMYLSTTATGQRNVVTGSVLVPKGVDLATAPVVAMAPGTTGPAFRCTVSRFINSGQFYEQAMLNGLLEDGYVVVVTDYEGYHENPKTTYITGRAMGAAVLDIVRAATRLPQVNVPEDPDKVMTQGFSQGGGASMWAATMHPTYAPELNLAAASAGGVPVNLATTALPLEGGPHFGFFLNALIGLDTAYPELVLDSYIYPDKKQVLTDMVADDCTIELLVDYPNQSIFDYSEESPFVARAWQSRLNENVLGKVKLDVPVNLYHATNDPIVPFSTANRMRNDFCTKFGMKVNWTTYDTGHVTTVGRGNMGVRAYLATVANGEPAPSNC